METLWEFGILKWDTSVVTLKPSFQVRKGLDWESISYVDTDMKYMGMSGQPRASGLRDYTSPLTTTGTTNVIKNLPQCQQEKEGFTNYCR